MIQEFQIRVLPEKAANEPVSYTHLDVYKRQMWDHETVPKSKYYLLPLRQEHQNSMRCV